MTHMLRFCVSTFLSTLSLRRATVYMARVPAAANYFYPRSPCGERQSWGSVSMPRYRNFYPRSPCGERHRSAIENQYSAEISIHALLAESDFYHGITLIPHQQISIHALLAESDLVNTYHRIFGGGISIHALLAESDIHTARKGSDNKGFLSTLSLRRATGRIWSTAFA